MAKWIKNKIQQNATYRHTLALKTHTENKMKKDISDKW